MSSISSIAECDVMATTDLTGKPAPLNTPINVDGVIDVGDGELRYIVNTTRLRSVTCVSCPSTTNLLAVEANLYGLRRPIRIERQRSSTRMIIFLTYTRPFHSFCLIHSFFSQSLIDAQWRVWHARRSSSSSSGASYAMSIDELTDCSSDAKTICAGMTSSSSLPVPQVNIHVLHFRHRSTFNQSVNQSINQSINQTELVSGVNRAEPARQYKIWTKLKKLQDKLVLQARLKSALYKTAFSA